jgi:hypothetical protein
MKTLVGAFLSLKMKTCENKYKLKTIQNVAKKKQVAE